jgi:hypothetical protein
MAPTGYHLVIQEYEEGETDEARFVKGAYPFTPKYYTAAYHFILFRS